MCKYNLSTTYASNPNNSNITDSFRTGSILPNYKVDIATFVYDQDGDGVLTADDCDDNNPNAADSTNDSDCDGSLNGVDCDVRMHPSFQEPQKFGTTVSIKTVMDSLITTKMAMAMNTRILEMATTVMIQTRKVHY